MVEREWKVEAILDGRRVWDETETYSSGSSNLSAGCNYL
jgi:hypothetical protein